MLTICGLISTFLGCNYTSLPLPHTQAALLIFKWWQCILNMKREQYVIITECFFLTFTLWLVHFMFNQFIVVHLIVSFMIYKSVLLYHIICTPTHFMPIRHWGSKAQTQKRDDKFLHLDLWRENTDKGDYIMIPSEISWIEEKISSSRALVHPEYCKNCIVQTQITLTLSHVN